MAGMSESSFPWPYRARRTRWCSSNTERKVGRLDGEAVAAAAAAVVAVAAVAVGLRGTVQRPAR